LGELASSLDDGTSGRVENWERAISQYVNTPLAWVFGLGYKILIEVHDITPDNNFLQAFVEMGFLGLFSLVVFLFFVFEVCLNLLRRESEKGALLFSVWFGIAFSMLAVDVTTFWHNLPIYLILLMVCCENKAYGDWIVQPYRVVGAPQRLNRNDRI
jgi:O-antigen ligase